VMLSRWRISRFFIAAKRGAAARCDATAGAR